MARASKITASAPRTPFAISCLIVLVLFAATLLLCDVSKGVGHPSEGDWPALVDRILAVPIELTDVSDLRFYALPLGLALMLGWVAIRPEPRGTVRPIAVQEIPNRIGLGEFIQQHWLACLGSVALMAATMSAITNGTWEISRGYLFFLATNLLWAIVLSWIVKSLNAGRLLLYASIVAVLGGVLSLWHYLALGERFFQLPIGPITVTAGLGAMWATAAIGWLAGRLGRTSIPAVSDGVRPIGLIWALLVATCSFALLFLAARRGAMLGSFVAIGYVSGLVVWFRYPSRGVRAGIVGGVALMFLAGVGFVVQQSLSIEKVISVPLKVRYLYYEEMVKMLADAPLLGHGPDMFACLMTTRLAPVRAEMPHMLHGGVDFDGHNEWLQALFEWGVPGGLAYVAIPLFVVFLTAWRWPMIVDRRERAILLACAAGILATFVTELSSVNLRYTILSPWFWSMIGLASGILGRQGCTVETAGQSLQGPATVSVQERAVAGVICVALIAIIVADLRSARAHAMGRALMQRDDVAAALYLRKALGRFGTNRWLSTRTYLADSLTNILRASKLGGGTASESAMAAGREALGWWKELYARSPAHLATGVGLAETQYLLGDIAAARETLSSYLEKYKPYDKTANTLYLELAELTPRQVLDCVLRSLRHDRWDNVLLARVTEALAAPEVASTWPGRVATARADVATGDETQWREPLAPEILRVEAFRQVASEGLAVAVDTQMTAAEAYAALAAKDSRMRRLTPAEVDAWYLAARFIFDIDAGNYAEAYRRIVIAERFASQGLRVERRRSSPPNEPYVGGRVIPLEAPERLRDMWRFSAMMYMSMRASSRQISFRITWSLPTGLQASRAEVQTEIGRLATELLQRYGPLPESRRPPAYNDLVQVAQQFGPRQQPQR